MKGESQSSACTEVADLRRQVADLERLREHLAVLRGGQAALILCRDSAREDSRSARDGGDLEGAAYWDGQADGLVEAIELLEPVKVGWEPHPGDGDRGCQSQVEIVVRDETGEKVRTWLVRRGQFSSTDFVRSEPETGTG